MNALLAALLLFASSPRLDKMARLLALEDTRSVGAGELDRYLRDSDRGVRRRAALAAARIGDASVVASLVELMNDGEAEVRQMAAFALGLVGDRLATERLLASLADTDATVRGRSAEALGRLGDPRAGPAIARMIVESTPKGAPVVAVRGDDPGSAQDPWLELRLALFALARLKDARAAEQALLVSGRPRFDWWAATWTAMRIESPALRPVLAAALDSTDPLSRAFAARGLGALKDAASVERLNGLVRDADANVVVNAVRALGAIGDARGSEGLTTALLSRDLAVVREALQAVASLPPDRSFRARIVPFVGHERPMIRAAALEALARVDAEEFTLVLSGLDPDPEWFVRSALATALGRRGGESSVAILFELLKDPDVRVLPAVLEAMQKARGGDAAATLRQHLEHADVAVRAAAIAALAELKAPGLVPLLEAAYRRGLGDAEIDARVAAVEALAGREEPAASGPLREASTGDPARVVRQKAAAALAAKGAAPPPAGAEGAERPILDYREAMLPYAPPAGASLFTPRAILHTSRGRIEVHLNIVEAPLTVRNFVALARRGFFHGLTFHRVVPGFVIQGGDPRGDGNGGPGYTIRCEIGQRPYGRGAVGMALAGKDTGGSQFFITHVPTPHVDGGYTLFGWVADGMEVVDRIEPGDTIDEVEIWDGT
ncbi:MAG TPA: HEAT repeat domain-containing protein [Vicinamibacteria bacterium]|nr:HEAT repeat domain-containing protein [Vicinamibacteria bacterium]